ncbi:MAG: hypothetical protein CFK49_02975 [Armatimonadetes bacterium JP3_11]|nr:MAG: hypothetical protein CFK49_02975 [Armatimonadetes bacterium JP3_11]RMH06126.1 MAG: hypothetical protein D6697_11285 [Armatimonadota bacterium]
MRVYNRAIGAESWSSVEDYLPVGNALGYNQNWHYRHTGGELLMMGATGEPSGYYPMDSDAHNRVTCLIEASWAPQVVAALLISRRSLHSD